MHVAQPEAALAARSGALAAMASPLASPRFTS